MMLFNLSTPKFWHKKNSFISWALWPISLIYKALSQFLYAIQIPKKISIPVICIGNATVGGSGKTPFAIALATLLQKHNYNVFFACKNYRAKIKIPTKVHTYHTAGDIVDEAMLLSKIAPTYVAKNRLAAITLAAQDKPDVIIIDDGLQNNSFYKDISILVIDDKLELNNTFIFPAGPFRENLEDSKNKSDIICYINPKKRHLTSKEFQVKAHFTLPQNKHKKYIAFTGIAFPTKFFHALESLKIKISKTFIFPDHYQYRDEEIINLIKLSKNTKIPLITTSKDMIKIDKKYKKDIDVLEISLKIKNENNLLKIIQKNENNH